MAKLSGCVLLPIQVAWPSYHNQVPSVLSAEYAEAHVTYYMYEYETSTAGLHTSQ
jgi:hypothetical protein